MEIENYISSLFLSHKIILTGWVSHGVLPVYLNAADVYIMGSYVEGLSTSLFEAVAYGKPAVCTNFSSAQELITNNENVYVIKNHNIDNFVNAVLKSRTIPKEKLEIHVKKMQEYSTKYLIESILNKW